MAKATDERARPPSIGAYLLGELRQAFQDIRQKVVEESWFGRVVTAAPVVEMDRPLTAEPGIHGDVHHHGLSSGQPLAEERHSFDERWRPQERADREHGPAMEHDLGMDR